MCSTKTTLTGATRYRTERRMFKPDVLVLQVQEHTTDGPDDWHGMPTYLAGTYWRDARPEDLQLVLPRASCTPSGAQPVENPPV